MLADTLRLCAQSLTHSKSALGAKYRRLRVRLGAPKAIVAIARHLARLVYRMLRYRENYVEKGIEHYERKFRLQRTAPSAGRDPRRGYKRAKGGWRYNLWPGSATHASTHARRLTGGISERTKARLDWKFEVAFGLPEVFDRLVSTVGAISLSQGY